jgi:hypothetical protein
MAGLWYSRADVRLGREAITLDYDDSLGMSFQSQCRAESSQPSTDYNCCASPAYAVGHLFRGEGRNLAGGGSRCEQPAWFSCRGGRYHLLSHPCTIFPASPLFEKAIGPGGLTRIEVLSAVFVM